MKNWTVKTEQLKNKDKGVSSFSRYLLNGKEASHKHTTITDIRDIKKIQRRINASYLERKAERTKLGIRGGGVSNLAQSYMLSLPQDIQQLKIKDWEDLTKRIAFNLAKDLNGYPQPEKGPPRRDLNPNEIYRVLGAVLHEQEKGHGNNHLHVVIGNIVGEKSEFRKDLTQLRASFSIKNTFNDFVFARTNTKVEDYQPIEPGKDLENWQYKQQAMEKLFDKFTKQLNSWIGYARQNNEMRIKATEKRLLKTEQEIADIVVSKKTESSKTKVLEKIREAKAVAEESVSRKFKMR